MTVTVWQAHFKCQSGDRYFGNVQWDKHTPGRLDAQIGLIKRDNIVSFPIWKASAVNHLEGEKKLVEKILKEAASQRWTVEDQGFTEFSNTVDKETPKI